MNKLLIIDVGHGGSDSGASQQAYHEKELNLIIAKRVRELLKEYTPDMTRTTDKYIGSTERANMIRNKYQYCLSIHLNSGGGRGIETIHSIHSTKGKQLAETLAKSMSEETGVSVNRIFSRSVNGTTDYYFMHRLTGNTITVIVECLYIDGEDINSLNVEKIAQGISKGFKNFIDNQVPNKNEEVTDITYTMLKPLNNVTLRNGMRNEDVKRLQRALIILGYKPNGIDGSFGNGCLNAVKAFQKENGLSVDGSVGPATRAKINSLLSNIKPKSRYFTHGDAKIIETTPDNLELKFTKDNIFNEDEFGVNGTVYNGKDPFNIDSFWSIGTKNGKAIGGNSMLNNYNGVKRGTFVHYKDGSMDILTINSINEIKKPHNWAIGGWDAYPIMDSKINSDVNYKTNHTYIGFNGDKVYLIVKPNHWIKDIKSLCKALGLDKVIVLDGGGSSQLSHYYGEFRSSRKNNHIIRLKHI